jgi:hypothetical protein
MDSEIHQAFLHTTYRVLNSPSIDIKINQTNTELNMLENWAFISAWNPHPDILSLVENQSRNKQLEQDIKQLGLKFSLGIGISEDQKWSEESFFIANIDIDKANELSSKYRQLAFVYGIRGETATLYYTFSEIFFESIPNKVIEKPKIISIFAQQTSRFFPLGRKKPTETRVHGGK